MSCRVFTDFTSMASEAVKLGKKTARLLFGGVTDNTVRRCKVLLNGINTKLRPHAARTGRVYIKMTEKVNSKDSGLFYSPTPTLAGPLCTYYLL